MNKLIISLAAAILSLPVAADEGMWLLPLLKGQRFPEMQALGLKLQDYDIYSPDSASLKDAVVIFGGGCTGEIVSPEGLLLTNHHCGYGCIQRHSTLEHDYLTDGFWAMSRDQELPNPGMTVTFIDKIEDVTDYVKKELKKDTDPNSMNFLSPKFLNGLAKAKVGEKFLQDNPGTEVEIKAFYGGNQYFMFTKKIYSDIRLVGAPPSSIGKFGADTDNWMWPRHTGDFSVFRVYADANGNPAPYSDKNVPLRPKRWFKISLKGVQENDYAMMMGFPGRTNKYYTSWEVAERRDIDNTIRIHIRDLRQKVMLDEMLKDPAVRIQYASKYAGSSNYWKNSIGMNKAIADNKVLETKAAQEARFAKFAKDNNRADYAKVVGEIDAIIEKSNPVLYQFTCFNEILRSGIEFGTPYIVMDSLKVAVKNKDKAGIKKYTDMMKSVYESVHNKDYDHEVDRKVAKALLPLYAEMVEADALPSFYQTIQNDFKGNYDAYIDNLYDNSIFSNEKNFNKFISKPNVKALEKDPMYAFVKSKYALGDKLVKELSTALNGLELLHKTYVRGLCEMYSPEPKAPDANFTIRLTYGNVKSYNPKDGIHYKYYTTLKGVMEKEDPTNPEFVVPAKLKELYTAKDFGRYALPNGEMPACFLTTNDITGGNSGSPFINGSGELIGTAFDGNWESLSGDINFDNNLQRCIAVDIRYVLFIIDKLGGCGHLIDEMTIVE